MDDELTLVRDQDDNLEEVPGAVRADDQVAVGILAGILGDECVVDGVEDVLVGDSVAPRGLVNLHTQLSYYESRGRREEDRQERKW